MKQDDIILAYKAVVDSFNATDGKIRAMVNLLPDAPAEEGQPAQKMVTPDINKCLYIASTYMEDARLRIGAVFQEMLRYSEEFVEQALAAEQVVEAPAKGQVIEADFAPKEKSDAGPETTE